MCMKLFQILERALEECGNDLDAALKRLDEITMGSSVENVDSTVNSGTHVEQGTYILILQSIVSIDTLSHEVEKRENKFDREADSPTAEINRLIKR